MKKMKKVLAVILSLAMVLGMSLTAFADEPNKAENATGSSTDEVKVTISGLTGNPTVTLYRIAEGNYQGAGTGAFVDYTWASNIGNLKSFKGEAEDAKALDNAAITKKAEAGLTADQITEIVNGINGGTVSKLSFGKDAEGKNIESIVVENVQETFETNVKAGAYIAVITNASDNSVYNPILLTASYDPTGAFVGGNIAAGSNYLFGTNAVAKKSSPGMDKKINTSTSGGAEDSQIPDSEVAENKGVKGEKTKWTASVGDKIDYDVKLNIPSYPVNSVNQTLFLADTMTEGLTYLPESLTINIGTEKVTANANGEFMYKGAKIATVSRNKKVVDGETVKTVEINGFYLNFEYENLISDKTTGATYSPISVSYSAVVNDKAVVAPDANENDARMYYANVPSQGSTFEPTEENPEPQEGNGIKKIEDKEKVFTYQLAFKKTGEGDEAKKLANAVFGVYAEEACTTLIDIVKTNKEGYAVSTSVGAGKYWVKEIEAPTGYSLNEKAYEVTANWKTATTVIKRKTEEVKYTSVASEAEQQPAQQVGWLYNNVFYDMAKKPADGAKEAYVLKRTVTETETTTAVTNPDGTVGGTVLMADITNTKLASLPSTGGIGTTIFTIGGCAIMIIAAALFFASRRRAVK